MPLYSYSCKTCGSKQEAYSSIDERRNGPKCHGNMQIVIGCNILPDIEPFVAPGTDEFISSRSKRRAFMQKHGLIEVGNEGNPHDR